MSSSIDPVYRLTNLKRRLGDLLRGRRLSIDPEESGVVDLADFGARCDELAEFAAESVRGLAGRPAEWVCEEVELAARTAARLETLPRSAERIGGQCELLEETAKMVEAALAAEGLLVEQPAHASLSAIAGRERDLHAPFVAIEGTIEAAPAGRVEAARARRELRRALLGHEDGAFSIAVTRDGVLRFGEFEFATEAGGDELPRSAHEPPETKKALDLREATDDESLRDFLLVKAVDETACGFLVERLGSHEVSEKARAFPRRPGKRFHVRPEAVARPVEGWNAPDAARCVEKVAQRRAGPDWARLPKAVYPLRLFFTEDDALAGDLLALGPALRRMEKGGEATAAETAAARRALRGLLGLLG